MNGWAIIEVDKIYDDQTASGIYKDVSFDKHKKMMIKGRVVSAPDKGNNEFIGEYEYRFPTPTEPDQDNYIRNRHLPVTIKNDDIVYFHYLTLEDPGNFLGTSKGKMLYKVGINNIFCSRRGDDIIMHNGYVLGKPYFGEGWEEVEVNGKIVAGKANEAGLIVQTKDKPLANVAKISVIGKILKARGRDKLPLNRERVSNGSIVLLVPNCEFENEIDGENYWVFSQKDIVATFHGERLQPEGDYVHIAPRYRKHEGSIYIPQKEYMGIDDEGTIIEIGELVPEYFAKGADVKFALKRHRKYTDSQGVESLFVRCGEVFGVTVTLV